MAGVDGRRPHLHLFISTENLQDSLSVSFLVRARAASWHVEHSPDGCNDPRWRTWYAVECERTVALADMIVCIVTPGWDGSSGWRMRQTPRFAAIGPSISGTPPAAGCQSA